MSALPAAGQPAALPPAAADWARIEAAAPEAAAVMRRYLRQPGTFLAPASVEAADNALRHLARWMVTEAGLLSVGGIRRDHIEDFKVWLAARPRAGGRVITAETHRQRMRTVRQFFERIIEWDWPDAPPRNPVIAMDIPKVVLIGSAHWLRIPLGKLRNDRYVPPHPELTGLLAAWTAANLEHIRRCKRLVADHRGPLDRHRIARIVRRVARTAGVPGVHPHRLRHTLATQAINRGMRLEAIAALLGHKKMEMTLICARIANRVVADEYAAVSAKIDALYGQRPEPPADYESAGMACLRPAVMTEWAGRSPEQAPRGFFG